LNIISIFPHELHSYNDIPIEQDSSHKFKVLYADRFDFPISYIIACFIPFSLLSLLHCIENWKHLPESLENFMPLIFSPA